MGIDLIGQGRVHKGDCDKYAGRYAGLSSDWATRRLTDKDTHFLILDNSLIFTIQVL